MLELPHVADLHHLHFWSLDGEEHVLTVHLVLSKNLDIEARSDLKQRIDDVLAPYALSHTTVELEDPDEDLVGTTDNECIIFNENIGLIVRHRNC